MAPTCQSRQLKFATVVKQVTLDVKTSIPCGAGFFVAEPSQAAVSLIKKDGGQLPEAGQRNTLWLVYKWEGLQPLALYPSAEQQLPVFFWAQGSDGQTRARFRMLRCCPFCCQTLTDAARGGALALDSKTSAELSYGFVLAAIRCCCM